MTTCIGLLRAVNVAGHNRVRMADLRVVMERLGLRNPRTLLQSGNVVFESAGRTPSQLESLLETGAANHLGVETEFFVRSGSEWKTAVARNPFKREAEQDPGRLVVVCLKTPARAGAVAALQRAIKGPEVVRADGRHLYIVYPDGMGRSKLTMTAVERQLESRGTARNWNTVLKLLALTDSDRLKAASSIPGSASHRLR